MLNIEAWSYCLSAEIIKQPESTEIGGFFKKNNGLKYHFPFFFWNMKLHYIMSLKFPYGIAW